MYSVIEKHAQTYGDQKRLTFLDDIGIESASFSFQELHEISSRVGMKLVSLGQRGKPIVIVCSSNKEFVIAFFACLYSGAIAVPACPPGRKKNETWHRLKAIVENTKTELVITDQFNTYSLSTVRQLGEEHTFNIASINQLLEKAGQQNFVPPEGESAAFIQYSSGTTGNPKGIVISHDNLLTNLQTIKAAFGLTSDTRLFGWLPLFHDMGLVGNLLAMAYVGGTSFLMKAGSFIQKPYRWLEGMTHYRADTSGGPNFAYDLCYEKIREDSLVNLDLSEWKTAFNGAEVIHASSIDRFSKRFAVCGFKREAFLPCYGMAEATLLVSGAHLSEIPQGSESIKTGSCATKIFTSGPVCSDFDLKVVNSRTKEPVVEGETGEIWISGPSVAKRYWCEHSMATDALSSTLEGDPTKCYFRTGDIGTVVNEQLFVTGRAKELIIIRGKNFYPVDIEAIVAALHPSFAISGTAAFQLSNDGQQLGIVQEVQRSWIKRLDFRELENSCDAAIREYFAVVPSSVSFVLEGRLPRTTSGKIKRKETARLLLAGGLNTLNLSPQISNKSGSSKFADITKTVKSISTWIAESITTELGLPRGYVSTHMPLSQIGLDSVFAARLTGELSEIFDLPLDASLFFEVETIEEAAEEVLDRMNLREVR